VLELQVLETFRGRCRLGVDQLELLAGDLGELRACFRAYANPINSRRCGDRPIGFYSDGEAVSMNGFDKWLIELEEGFAARENDIAAIWPSAPGAKNGIGEFDRRSEGTPTHSVGANKFRITKSTDGRCAVLFAATPEVAARKSTEDSGATSLSAFSLERFEEFFDRVSHFSSYD
jgi:hypothetical protein